MVNHIVEHSLISKNQHGFVNKKACVTNLLGSIDMMSKALSMDVAFIDLSKAFDMVPHKRLIYKLEVYGFTGNLLNWINLFLHQRFQRIVMGDYVSLWLEVFSGVPQGSVLDPILFIIFVNNISNIVNHSCKMYADDTKLQARLDHPLASQKFQTDIYNIVECLKDKSEMPGSNCCQPGCTVSSSIKHKDITLFRISMRTGDFY
ncbi:uncharacterized protein LOC124814080 [Hydra vulgaris]|uniref:uncharacterized protein LOC124814080 n=1 Tax=Hydra vulgaris TaxID=6087 RepID=UPI001F5ED749|nr:uncharacterized protein LOC124814080 [Hydra vulgaris]